MIRFAKKMWMLAIILTILTACTNEEILEKKDLEASQYSELTNEIYEKGIEMKLKMKQNVFESTPDEIRFDI